MSHSLRIRIPTPTLEDEFRTPGQGKEGSQRGLQQPPCAVDGSTSKRDTSDRNEQENIEETSSISTIVCPVYRGATIPSSESKKELEILQKKGDTLLRRLIRYIGC